MILPNIRASLTRNDAAHVVTLLGRDDDATRESARERLDAEGLDALLDDPRTLNAILTGGDVSLPPPLVFYVVVRHALLEGRIDDREIADYVSTLMVSFATEKRAYRIHDEDEAEYRYLVDMLQDLHRATGRRAFLLKVHLGNYSLWLSGLFPDWIEARVRRRGAPPIDYYEEMGAAGFRLASETRAAESFGLEDVLRTTGRRFTGIRRALNRVSDRYLWPRGGDPVSRLLRQVAEDFEGRDAP